MAAPDRLRLGTRKPGVDDLQLAVDAALREISAELKKLEARVKELEDAQ